MATFFIFAALPANASTVKATYKGSFSKAWELYKSGDNGKANLTYGFNTAFINEDYAWAKHSTKSHFASLKNGKGFFPGPTKAAKVTNS